MFTILTQQLNNLAGQSWFLEQATIFFAVYVIWLMVLGYVLALHYCSIKGKLHDFFLTVLVIGILYVISFIIGYLLFEPRPYTIGLTNLLINEPMTAKSFPSDHAAIAFVLALGFWRLDKRWWPMLLVALLVAIARVAAGVHYLYDVAAGAILGILVSFIVEKIYNNFLARLRQHLKS